MTSTTEHLAQQLGEALKQRKWKLVTAESCTAGGLAYAITTIPGSSNWLDCGYITYSNRSKKAMLDVKSQTLNAFGAVSEQTAREMAEGALSKSQAQISIAITGIAGPDGGTPAKPVGTVWFAWTSTDLGTESYQNIFSGNRIKIREQSIETALKKLIEYLEK